MRKEKDTAIKLRIEGKSYNEINQLLDVPKSTLSGWLRGVQIPTETKKHLWNESRRKWAQNMIEYNRQRVVEALQKTKDTQEIAAKEVGSLTQRDLWLIGTALYWAEGSKKDRWRVRFCNSDPAVISIMMQFFRKICRVDEAKIRAALQIYPNISEEEVKEFWSNLTKIPPAQFIKSQTAISKSSKLKRDRNTLPYGTLHIAIHDTKMLNKIKGWILGISQACS